MADRLAFTRGESSLASAQKNGSLTCTPAPSSEWLTFLSVGTPSSLPPRAVLTHVTLFEVIGAASLEAPLRRPFLPRPASKPAEPAP